MWLVLSEKIFIVIARILFNILYNFSKFINKSYANIGMLQKKFHANLLTYYN